MKQTFKTNSGSLHNMIMSNNESIPVAGEYATIMGYTDRYVYKVLEVLNPKAVMLAQTTCRHDESGYGIEGTYQETGFQMTIVYRNGCWKKESTLIVFTKEFMTEVYEAGFDTAPAYMKAHKPMLLDLVYRGHIMPSQVVLGVTKEKKEYTRVNILFGAKNAYHDNQF